MAGVEVEELRIRYGDTVAVDGVSFAAQEGEVTVLLGPNGAGKTSTIEHLEGYRGAESGRARVLGLDPRRDHARLTRLVGIMLQEGGIPLGIRPAELLTQYAGFFEDPGDPADLLRRVGLSDRSRTTVRRLSGGERQRLSLALALVGRPRVVFLDEPTAGVDVAGRDLIRAVVAELRSDGVTVVLTTHDLDEAERVADRVVIVDHGRVVADGAPAELTRAGDHLLFGAVPGLEVAALSAAVGHPVAEVTPGEYRVGAAATPELVAAVTAWLAGSGVALADMRAGRQRLDDVFRRLTSERPDGGDHGGPPAQRGDRPEGPDRPRGRRRGRRRR